MSITHKNVIITIYNRSDRPDNEQNHFGGVFAYFYSMADLGFTVHVCVLWRDNLFFPQAETRKEGIFFPLCVHNRVVLMKLLFGLKTH